MRSPTTWTRLVPRFRDRELRESLTAPVGDPLWLLGRQWQLGELRGEDAGSPVSAELTVGQRPFTGYSLGLDGPVEPYRTGMADPSPPLETLVERERVRPPTDGGDGDDGGGEEHRNLRSAVEAGEQFRRFLADEGVSCPVAAFEDVDPSGFPGVDGLLLDPGAVRDDAASHRYLDVVRGRTLDGDALYRVAIRALPEEMEDGPADDGDSDDNGDETGGEGGVDDGTDGGDNPPLPLPDPPPDDVAAYRRAFARYRDWYADLYAEPTGGDGTDRGGAWDEDRLEYGFTVAAGTGEEQAVFGAEEYPGGRLDWYSFDYRPGERLPVPEDDQSGPGPGADEAADGVGTDDGPEPAGPEAGAPDGADVDATDEAPGEVTLESTPAPVRYRGMPAPRWWELEDSQVNLSDIDAGPEDLSRLLLLEFALLYGNDWFAVPVELPVGTLATVSGLTVRDTFGRRTEVGHASADDPEPGEATIGIGTSGGTGTGTEEPWQLFDFDVDGERGLLMPPVLADVLETDPVEEVRFVRDEMVNVAWGLEERVEGPTGAPLDRHELDQEAERDPSSDRFRLPVASTADASYRLATDVPGYWLPLVPVQDETHQVRLHLGELLDGSGYATESWGRILVDDLAVPEEEVPRSGATVGRSYQLARWMDGSTYLWSGRRKGPGRGRGSSGLRFDVTEDRQDRARGTARAGDDGPPVAVVSLQSRPPGSGTERLNDEYLVLENVSGHPLPVTGWTVSDAAGHTYTFDRLTLAPKELVLLRTGPGTDSADGRVRHWGSSRPVWNDAADEVLVHDADGELVLSRSYPDLSGVVEGSPVGIAEIHVDARDDDHRTLADEYVVLENTGEGPVDVAGWVVRDIAGHRYVFPDDGASELEPGGRVTLRTGSGRDEDGTRYWGSGRPVWNNTDDAVLVYDPDGRLMAGRVY